MNASSPAPKQPDPDADAAAALEYFHELLLIDRFGGDAWVSSRTSDVVPSDNGKDDLYSKYSLLRLIDRVRRLEATERRAPATLISGDRSDRDTAIDRTIRDDEWLAGEFGSFWESRDLDPMDAFSVAPRRWGRFQINGVLGRGGFGVVFRAHDPQLDRPIALKVPRPDALSADGRKRFLREATAAALLGHPHIVTVYESGQIGGILYTAYELVDGISLAEWLRRRDGRCSHTTAAEIVATLAAAIEHAHRRGIVHRDLKPGNVLLACAELSSGLHETQAVATLLRITDFGLALVNSGDLQSLTQTGAMVGTPSYMAPEQIGNTANSIGPAADIYALGAILYELLTGYPPFRKETLLATLRAVETEDPVPPGHVRHDLSPDLEAICLKCLEKEAGQRYPCARELEDDLRRWVRGEPVTARSIRFRERLWRWMRRRPALAAAIGAACLISILGLTATTWQWYRARTQWIRAEANLAEAKRQGTRAEQHLDHAETAIDQMLSHVADSFVGVPQMERLRNRFYRDALELQKTILDQEPNDGVSRFRTARAYRRMVPMLMALGELQESLASADKARELLQGLPEKGQFPTSLALERGLIELNAAQVHFRLETLEPAKEAAQRAIAEFKSIAAEPLDTNLKLLIAQAHRNLGRALVNSGALEDGKKAFQTSLEVLASISDLEPEDAAVSAEKCQLELALGLLLARMSRMDEAVPTYQAAIQTADKLVAAHRERVDLKIYRASAYSNLGVALGHLERHGDALNAKEQACAEYRELATSFPDSSNLVEDLCTSLADLGRSYRDMKRLDDACRTLTQAVEIGRGGLERFPESKKLLEGLTTTFASLSNAQLESGDVRTATQTARQGVEFGQRLLANCPDAPDSQYSYSRAVRGLARVLAHDGANSDAITQLNQGLVAARAAQQAIRTSPAFRGNLIWYFVQLSIAHCELDAHDCAIQSIQSIAEIEPMSAELWEQAAIVAMMCLAEVDSRTASSPDPNPVQAIYHDAALRHLRQAIVLGYDPSAIAANPKFQSLVPDPRFQQIVTQP